MDDGYDPVRAVNNTQALLASNIFAMLGTVGTPTAAAMLPVLNAAGVPLIGPFTGAQLLRHPFIANVLNLRAAYHDEIAAMVEYAMVTYGANRFGIFHQNDSYGLDGLEGLRLEMSKRGLKIKTIGTYERNTVVVQPGFDKMQLDLVTKQIPFLDAIFTVGTYRATAAFVRLCRASTWANKAAIFSVSFVGTEQLLAELGTSADNVFVGGVFPLPPMPSSTVLTAPTPYVQDYLNALELNRTALNFTASIIGLEAYLAARFAFLVCSLLEPASLTRAAFVSAVYERAVFVVNQLRLGPYGGSCDQVAQGCQCNQGSRKTYILKLSGEGKISNVGEYGFGTCGVDYTGTGNPIVFGQSAILGTGALGSLVQSGIQAAFAAVNKNGGVHGRPLVLLTYQDNYDPSWTYNNTRELLNVDSVFGLIGYVGTPTSQAVISDGAVMGDPTTPFIAPFSGAQVLRKPFIRSVLNIRASYWNEVEVMIKFLVTKGLDLSRIAAFYQDDAFGKDGLEGLKASLSSRGFSVLSTGTYVRNTLDVETGLASITQGTAPSAILLVGTSAPLAKMVKLAKAQLSQNTVYFTVSFVGAEMFVQLLGENTAKVYISQVVPVPTGADAFTATYWADLQSYYGSATAASAYRTFASLEGYVAAQFVIQILNRIDGSLSTSAFLDVIYSGSEFTFGDSMRLGPFQEQCNTGVVTVFVTNGTLALVPGATKQFDVCEFTCAAGTEKIVDSSGRGFCVKCKTGFFNRDADEVCHACPQGGSCPGGTEVLAEANYWQDPATTLSPVFYKCDADNCCPGGQCATTSACEQGFAGVLCGECPDGMYPWSGRCVECTNSRSGGLIFAFVIVSFIGVVALALWPRSTSTFIRDLVYYYQVAVSLVDLRGSATSFIKFISLDFQIVSQITNSASCVAPLSEFEQLVLKFFLPLVLFAEMVVVALFVLLWRRVPIRFRETLTRCWPRYILQKNLRVTFLSTIFQILVFSVMPVIRPAFIAMDCRKVGSISVLRAAPSVVCGSSRHVGVVVLAAIALVVMGVIIPIWILAKVRSRRHTLRPDDLNDSIGVFYQSYRPECYWYMAADIAERIIIVAVSVGFAYNSLYQPVAVFLTLWLLCLFYFELHPRRHRMDNTFKLLTLMCLIVLSMLAAVAQGTGSRLSGLVIFFLILPVAPVPYKLYIMIRDTRKRFRTIEDGIPMTPPHEDPPPSFQEAVNASSLNLKEKSQFSPNSTIALLDNPETPPPPASPGPVMHSLSSATRRPSVTGVPRVESALRIAPDPPLGGEKPATPISPGDGAGFPEARRRSTAAYGDSDEEDGFNKTIMSNTSRASRAAKKLGDSARSIQKAITEALGDPNWWTKNSSSSSHH